MSPVAFVNGRFLTQPVTGVQRFAGEITAAIDQLVDSGEWPDTSVMMPQPPVTDAPAVPGYRRLRVATVGRTRGQIWEQVTLPGATRDGILVNLGNTAPLLAGRRQVVVIHDAGVFDTPESYSLRFRLWYKALQHALVQSGARIVTVSEFSRRRIAIRLGLDPARVAVILEGADHVLRVAAAAGALDHFGLRPGRYVLVVGSRVAHKNLAALADISRTLAGRGLAVAVAGGARRGVFQDHALPGLAERALGRVTDAELRALYESAACLIFPSRYEGFGLPPVEAMACGCPVVASGGGSVEEVCGDAALYVPASASGALATVVERLLDEPGLADAMRARGRARVAALSWAASARRLGEVVKSLQ